MSHPVNGARRTVSRSGLALVCLGVAANEWVLARLVSADHSLALTSRLGIWLLDLGLIAAGLTLVLVSKELPWKLLAANLLLFGLLLSLVEVFLLFAFRWPLLLPSGRPLGMVEVLYSWQRQIIQYSRSCARYDPGLGYTLRPGLCTFSNPEFSNEFRINRLGLRDDEISLDAPRIVVLGDSFAMGWGVDRQQAFPQLLEASLGTPVLNAALSSYGTAREGLLLARIDLSRLELLVIQYGANDFEENRSYRDSGDHLGVSSSERYQRRVEAYEQERRYHFGSYLWKLTITRLVEPMLFAVAKSLFPDRAAPTEEEVLPADRQQAELFLHVLETSMRDLLPERVLVLELNTYAETDSTFITELAARLRATSAHPLSSRIEAIDVSGRLTPDHYYRLDDHLNAAGHQEVTAAILERIAPEGADD